MQSSKEHGQKSLYYLIENNKIVYRELTEAMHEFCIEFTSFFENFAKQKYDTDLKKLKAAITLTDYIIKHKYSISPHYFIATQSIACVLMLIYPISDQIKNRNLHIAPESGWWLLELLAKLFFHDFKEDQRSPTAAKIYVTLNHYMLPKIIHEDLEELRKLLTQIYDTECLIAKKHTDKEFPLFSQQPTLVCDIARLQIEIEQGMAASLDVTQQSTALDKIVADYQLKVCMPHAQFFCATVNNYYSLKKLISLLEGIEGLTDFVQEVNQHAFLYTLVQVGEYMTHKKLTNRFRENYPHIPWEAFQIIRDCLEHADENQRFIVINELLDQNAQDPEINLKNLQKELLILKVALKQVFDRSFSNPNAKFMQEYFDTYDDKALQEHAFITGEDRDFFITNLDHSDESLIAQWQSILDGRLSLPHDSRKYGQLVALVPKDKDPNKDKRQRCAQLINSLGEPSKMLTEFDKSYLLENLEINEENRACVTEIFSNIGRKLITRADKKKLNDLVPKKPVAENKEVIKRYEIILNKLKDIRDMGDCILYPSEKKQFEKSLLYRENPEFWSRIIAKKGTPRIDDYMQLENPVYVGSINNIAVKLQQYIKGRFQEKWSVRFTHQELQQFSGLLERYPDIQRKWLCILNDEAIYPDPTGFRMDLEMILRSSHEDAKEFVKLTNKLSPIIADLPATKKLMTKFKEERSGYVSKNKSVLLATQSVSRINEFSNLLIESHNIIFQAINEIAIPLFNKRTYQNIHTNPAYRAFVKKRMEIMDEVKAEAQRYPDREIIVPCEKIQQLYEQMVGPLHVTKTDELEIEENAKKLFVNVLEKSQQRFSDTISRRLIFRNAIIFNLTIVLTLLKKIIKFDEIDAAPFLKDNYILLKKARNELVHGDYIKESLDEGPDKTVIWLHENRPAISYAFNEIKNEINKVAQKIMIMIYNTEPAYEERLQELSCLLFNTIGDTHVTAEPVDHERGPVALYVANEDQLRQVILEAEELEKRCSFKDGAVSPPMQSVPLVVSQTAPLRAPSVLGFMPLATTCAPHASSESKSELGA